MTASDGWYVQRFRWNTGELPINRTSIQVLAMWHNPQAKLLEYRRFHPLQESFRFKSTVTTEKVYSYDAFGNIIEKTEKVENRFCYNGEMLDPVTQQYYLRARFYNPVIGRFTQEDTYYGDGLNLYQYCQANPVGYVDPSGHTCEIVQNHYEQYQEYRKQHPEATAAEAYEAVTGKDPFKKDAGKSGNYSSLRDLMSPEEVARYDEHWLNVAENISNEALDNQIDFIKNGGITKPGGGAYKPAKISATVDLNTGDIYFGYNGANKFNPSIQEIHPDLQQRINRTMSLAGSSIDNEYASRMSFEKWSVDNCAEIYSVNNALQNQATLDNIFINTKYFKDGKYALPCRNCQVTFEGCFFPKQ